MKYPQCNGLGYKKFLKRMHVALSPNWYLEIGSSRGDSLAISKASSIAIDPSFAIKHDIWSGKEELHLFQMTSDAYFDRNGSEPEHPKIELAFLDGMHLFEYLLRDFLSTERVSSPDGIIVMHDCVPMHADAASRTWDRQKTRQWTGDVWKLVPILKSFRPDLNIRVVDCAPSGLVLVSGLDPENNSLSENYDQIVEEFSNMDAEDFGLDKLHESLAMISSESSEAAPFNTDDND